MLSATYDIDGVPGKPGFVFTREGSVIRGLANLFLPGRGGLRAPPGFLVLLVDSKKPNRWPAFRINRVDSSGSSITSLARLKCSGREARAPSGGAGFPGRGIGVFQADPVYGSGAVRPRDAAPLFLIHRFPSFPEAYRARRFPPRRPGWFRTGGFRRRHTLSVCVESAGKSAPGSRPPDP